MILWIEENRWFLGVVTFFIFIFIFYVSSLSFASPPPGSPTLSAKVYHMSVFFALTFFLLVSSLWRKMDLKIFSLCVATAVNYAILDELHQFFVPGRFMSFNDFVFDSLGIVFAALGYFLIVSGKS